MLSSGSERTSTSSAVTRACLLVQSIQGPSVTVTMHSKESPSVVGTHLKCPYSPLVHPVKLPIKQEEGSASAPSTLRVPAAPLLQLLCASQSHAHL